MVEVYQHSLKGNVIGLKWVILFAIIFFPLVLLTLTINTDKGDVLSIFFLAIFSIYAGPQLFLIIQYLNVSNYERIEIDYQNQTFEITTSGEKQLRRFAELKTVEYYKPNVSAFLGSPPLLLCQHLFYYKLSFQEESYYLTSMLLPKPMLRENAFYDTFIMRETRYARIRKR